MVPRFMEIHFSKRRWKLGHKMLKTAAQKKLFFYISEEARQLLFSVFLFAYLYDNCG